MVAAASESRTAIHEWVKYSAYGIPCLLVPGDVDGDFDVDSADTNQIQTWINGPTYKVIADLDLDGDVDAADKTIATNNIGLAGGWGLLSRPMSSGGNAAGNRKGYAGYEFDAVLAHSDWHVRHRVLDSDLGRWNRRDPIGYVDGVNLFGCARQNPSAVVDSTGTRSQTGPPAPGEPPYHIPPPIPIGTQRYVTACPNTPASRCVNCASSGTVSCQVCVSGQIGIEAGITVTFGGTICHTIENVPPCSGVQLCGLFLCTYKKYIHWERCYYWEHAWCWYPSWEERIGWVCKLVQLTTHDIDNPCPQGCGPPPVPPEGPLIPDKCVN